MPTRAADDFNYINSRLRELRPDESREISPDDEDTPEQLSFDERAVGNEGGTELTHDERIAIAQMYNCHLVGSFVQRLRVGTYSSKRCLKARKCIA